VTEDDQTLYAEGFADRLDVARVSLEVSAPVQVLRPVCR
jgi:hypothetical protein